MTDADLDELLEFADRHEDYCADGLRTLVTVYRELKAQAAAMRQRLCQQAPVSSHQQVARRAAERIAKIIYPASDCWKCAAESASMFAGIIEEELRSDHYDNGAVSSRARYGS